MVIHLFAGLMFFFFNEGRDGHIKLLHAHQMGLYARRFNQPLSSHSKMLSKVLNEPLIHANKRFAEHASNNYLTLTKVEGILSVLYRLVESKTSEVAPINRPFFAMDLKSYLFHPEIRTKESLFICPDIEGVFAPNHLIECILEEQVQDYLKRDAMLMPSLEKMCAFPEILEKIYLKATRRSEHLCLTQIAMHPSIAQALLYSMVNEYGNSLMEHSIAIAIDRRDSYLKSPWNYNQERECRITARRAIEHFEHRLSVHHYFCPETKKLISQLF